MEPFAEYYAKRFLKLFGSPPKTEEGLAPAGLRESLKQLHLVIPKALFDYYVFAGRHWINTNHNRLRPVEELAWIDDKLVFLDENQDVVCWGIDRNDVAADDPIVWQGAYGEEFSWYAEDYTLSRFLMAMWHWTMTGEAPSHEQ